MRESGPVPETQQRGLGNKVFYRLDRVAEWLSGGSPRYWEYSGTWLATRRLAPEDQTEQTVNERIELLRSIRLYP